jgi:hypothetical protein
MPKAQAASIWPLGNAQDGAAEGLGHVGAVDKTDGQYTGHEGFDVHGGFRTELFKQGVDADGATIKHQQHQHQIRNTTDDGGVKGGQANQHGPARELGRRTGQTKQDGHQQRHQ